MCTLILLATVRYHAAGESVHRWFLSCMGYPECRAAIWFPDFVLHASVDDAICDIVSVINRYSICLL